MRDHACRKCGEEFPATEEFFYRAGNYLNYICKPCMKAQSTAWKTERYGREAVAFACQTCGATVVRVVGSGGRAAFCSRACKERAKNAVEKAARLAAKPERNCVRCGNALPRSMRIDAQFCSAACNEAAHHQTRKFHRRAGAEKRKGRPLLSLASIGDRTGWRCGICGGTVDRKKKHPDPLAPSVDHIVPLSLGGTNEMSNLQISHLVCNLRKRNRT